MNIILLGAPGSGKGTLAKKITKDFGLVQISTGDLFRGEIAGGSELGLKLKSYMDKGQLVPDELTIKILSQRITKPDCKKGVIFDGFPRTVAQAEALKNIAKIDSAVLIDLPFEEIERRAVARRVCSKCGEIYSTLDYAGKNCAKCGGELFQRDDDKLETVRHRLEVYEKTTTPLIDFYSDRLFKVSSLGSPEDTYKPVKNFLLGLGGKK